MNDVVSDMGDTSTEVEPDQVNCFSMSQALCDKMKTAACNDWVNMVMPSIVTKTFGRTLMVLHVIHYTTALDFIWQNFIYAAGPIAFISGVMVGTYRYFEAVNQGKTKHEARKIAASFFLRTAVKFFIVYMSWSSSVALVTAAGWFAAPITAPVLITIGVCLASLAVLGGLNYLVRTHLENEVLKNILDFLIVATVFIAVAGASYFIGPTIMGLLIVGGITSLSLFCASFLTDVLTAPNRDMNRAWQMLARAYTEGVVWALVEHIGLHVLIGGVIGQIVDVLCVSSSVCLSIFAGGQLDAYFRHLYDESKKKECVDDESSDSENKIFFSEKNPNQFFHSTNGPEDINHIEGIINSNMV